MPLYRSLTEEELDQLRRGVEQSRRLCGSLGRPSVAELQALYDTLLEDAQRPESAVRALGFGFGGLLSEHDGLDWAMLADGEFDDDFAVMVSGRELGCSPLTMIQYRLEDGERWDLGELAADTVSKLRQLGQQAASK